MRRHAFHSVVMPRQLARGEGYGAPIEPMFRSAPSPRSRAASGHLGRNIMRIPPLPASALTAACLLASFNAPVAHAQMTDKVVRIGVLNDRSSASAVVGGVGSEFAARMAIEDVGGKVLGMPVDIVSADPEAQANRGGHSTCRWFDARKATTHGHVSQYGRGPGREMARRSATGSIRIGRQPAITGNDQPTGASRDDQLFAHARVSATVDGRRREFSTKANAATAPSWACQRPKQKRGRLPRRV